MKERLLNKRNLLITISVIVIVLLGTTYAWWTWTSSSNSEVTFAVEGLGITYEGDATVIKDTLYPTASMTNPDNVIHEFSLVSSINTDIYTQISLEIISFPTELNHESFRYSLYKDSNEIASGSFLNAKQGTDLLITPYEKISTIKANYTLYIWIDGANYYNPVSILEKSFEIRLKIDASQEDYVTDEECFVFNESTGTITDFLCTSGNSNNLPTVTNVVIPKTINGVAVTKIGASAFNSNNLTEATLSNNITEIGNYAFYGNGLTNIIIPDSVVTIGEYAFAYNPIANLTISNNATSIGRKAFQYGYQNTLTVLYRRGCKIPSV